MNYGHGGNPRAFLPALLGAFLSLAAPGASAQAPAPLPKSEGIALLPAAAGADIARQIASELKVEDFAALESRFDDTMKAGLPEASLRIFWAQTLLRAGALRGCAEPRMSVAGEFTVALSACTFEKQTAELRVVLRPDSRVAGLFLAPGTAARPDWTAPDYVTASAFTEREVSVSAGFVTLPGTLSMPKSASRVPGVVLVHGSGPQDRDETVGGTRVFQDLAQGLASRGIAVLRYEKRTKTFQKELAGTRDVSLRDEVLDDAVAALVVLRATPGVDPAKVFVVGHSLGGFLAPRIAALDGKTAGVVLLAAPSRPMSEVVHDQVAALSGPTATDAQKAMAPSLRREADMLADLYAGRPLPSQPATLFGAPPAYWLELKAETPLVALTKLGLPALVLQGGRDIQVTSKDFAGWQKGLKGVPRTATKAYPKLNHLFVAGEGAATAAGSAAEYEKPSHVDREVVDDIASFVERGTLRPAPKPAPKPKGAK